MKAYVLHEIDDFRWEDVPEPELKEDEVLVQVKAVGICGSDIPRIYKNGTYHFPTIPGHEFSGQVVKAGEKANKSWLDKRVGVFPLIPCKVCAPCKSGKYEMCRKYSYLGSRTDGAFAEYVAVPEWNLIELPDNVAYEQAAMLEPMAVAVHAMRNIAPKEGETVAVCGLGTVGTLLTMFLEEAGITNLFAVGNKDFQKQIATDMGISTECYLDSREKNISEWIMEHTDGAGVDVFFECVGKNDVISAAFDSTAPGGRVQLIGNPASDMSVNQATYWKILRNQLTIKGSWNSSFDHCVEDDWNYVLQRLEQGRIHPEKYITQRFDLEEIECGLKIMRDKTEEYVKIMVVML